MRNVGHVCGIFNKLHWGELWTVHPSITPSYQFFVEWLDQTNYDETLLPYRQIDWFNPLSVFQTNCSLLLKECPLPVPLIEPRWSSLLLVICRNGPLKHWDFPSEFMANLWWHLFNNKQKLELRSLTVTPLTIEAYPYWQISMYFRVFNKYSRASGSSVLVNIHH